MTTSDGIMAHPTDCSKFIGCTGGVGYEFLCPGGLKFDFAKGVCEWPETAVCGKSGTYVNWSVSGGGSSGGSKTGTATKQSAGGSSSYAWSSSSSSSSNGATKSTVWGGQKAVGISLGVATGKPVLKGVCPADKDGIKPHSSDCRKFIACTGGDGFEFLCPGGLHFDAPKGICNWPDQSKCQLGGSYVTVTSGGGGGGGGSAAVSSWSAGGGGGGSGTRQVPVGTATRQTGAATKTKTAPTKTKTVNVVQQRPQPPKQVWGGRLASFCSCSCVEI